MTTQLTEVQKDFRKFLYVVWKHLNLPDPTPVQYDMSKYIQTAPKRSIVMGFRGVGKSWITSAYVIWCLLNNPNLNILVVSASKDRSDQFSTFTKRLINEIEFLHHLRPKGNQRDSNVAFDVGPAMASHAPSVRSVGVMGQMTGGRADIIIADDVEVPNNSETQLQREKLSERVKEFDAILKPKGRILYLGTPQTEESLYVELEKRGYEIRIWPARVPSQKQYDMYCGRLAPIIVKLMAEQAAGSSTDSLRFTDIDLIERETSYGKAGFALQFMLDTTLSDAERYPLKLSDLIVMDVNTEMGPSKVIWTQDPQKIYNDLPILGLSGDKYYRPQFVSDDFKPYERSILAVDPSGRGKDMTAWGVFKVLHGMIYLIDRGICAGGYDDESLLVLCKKAKEHEVDEVYLESNFGDGMFTALLQKKLHMYRDCAVEEIRVHGQKEKRIIDTLEPVLMQHRLIVNRSLIREDNELIKDQRHKLFYQLTRLTGDKGSLASDDSVDMLHIGVGRCIQHMSLDNEEEDVKARQEALEDELENFMEHALGNVAGSY